MRNGKRKRKSKREGLEKAEKKPTEDNLFVLYPNIMREKKGKILRNNF